jgi:hypothetical protein
MGALESSIDAVLVFQRGAVITRVATAVSAEGEFAFEGLPLSLDDESVRLKLDGAAAAGGWSVADVQVEVDAPVREPTPEPDDDAAFEAATDARDRANAHLEATRASIESLRAVALQGRLSEDKERRPALDPTQGRLAWLELQRDALSSLHQTLEAQRVVLDDAEQALQALRDARAARSSDRDARAYEPRKRVVLRLRAGTPVDAVHVSVTYRVPGARWAPSYVLRLDTETGGTLVLRAVVAQRTGEDWTGARVTVSTASWQAWHDLPRLDALRVGRRQPAPSRAGWREPPPNPEGLYADYDRFIARLPPPATPASVVATADDRLGPMGGAAAVPERPKARPKAKKAAAPPPPPAGPPMPQSMPMPASAAAPMRASAVAESKGGFGFRGRARGGDALTSTGAFLAEDLADADAFDEPPEPPPPEHGLGRQWFDYGRLRLPLPHESGRGRLQRVSMVTSGDADRLAPIVTRARREANRIDNDALPPGHTWVDASVGHAYAYACEAQIDIPSDGQAHVVNVLDASLETSRKYVCVPRISPDVFRTLAARNPLEVPLPGGPLDVYERDAFLLSGTIESTGALGRFEVGLGVEQAIKVARNVAFSEDSEGLLKRSNTYAHAITVDVQNLLSKPASVEIRERVPVPAADEADVEVEETEVEPPWDRYEPKDDPLEGGRRWRIEVPAGEKTTLRTTYTVRVPGGSELVGGNRRDA